jgi:hypothetical protein
LSEGNEVARSEEQVLSEYRQALLPAEQKAQEDCDKTVVSLSGGALGVSFAFVKDLLADRAPACLWLLEVAWLAWGLSVTAILVSYFTSRFALRRAIHQVDDRSILRQQPGGKFTTWTQYRTLAAAKLLSGF